MCCLADSTGIRRLSIDPGMIDLVEGMDVLNIDDLDAIVVSKTVTIRAAVASAKDSAPAVDGTKCYQGSWL